MCIRDRGVIVYDIEVKGLGRGTKDVVEKAIDLKNKNNYDRVWACLLYTSHLYTEYGMYHKKK